MTAEIVLMNASAVALAADSAVTVGNGESGQKVFNTASKVFTLSKYAPVGIMIYSSASFCGIPWETIIKEYRNKLGKKRFPKLSDYSKDFIDYIEGNDYFFDDQLKKTDLMYRMYSLILGLLHTKGKTQSNKKVKSLLNKAIQILDAEQFLSGFSEEEMKIFITENADVIDELSENIFSDKGVSIAGCKIRIRKFVALKMFKKTPLASYSGVVISGFGDIEAFPALKTMKIDGFLMNKVRICEINESSLSGNNMSHIEPFAQTHMMESVLLGALPSYNSDVFNQVYEMLTKLPSEIINGISELTEEQKNNYKTDSVNAALELLKPLSDRISNLQANRFYPIKRSITMMPKSELALIAEVFVNVAQLEHRLSMSAETVGGPVDVAVISKGDGFVWIKRKHYFDSELNPGFVENYYEKDYI